MPGVLAVYTAADLAAYGSHKCALDFKQRDGSAMKKPIRKSLASDKVRFVGDPVACVVAETYVQAKDAAEAVELDIEPLPAAAVASEAAKPGAPQIYDDVPGNVSCDFLWGEPDKVAEAFGEGCARHQADPEEYPGRGGGDGAAGGAVLVRRGLGALDAERAGPGGVGAEGPARRHARGDAGQGAHPHVARRRLVRDEGVDLPRVSVPGARGARARAAGEVDRRALGVVPLRPARPRPRDDRRARARQGRQVPRVARHGLRQRRRVPRHGGAAAADDERGEELLQRLRDPAPRGVDEAVFTNTSPVGPYRGAGRPEANYYMERLIDKAAREMGIDRFELRRRNHVKPSEIPYKNTAQMTVDSGDFGAVFEKALKEADVGNFPERKRQSKAKGKLRGLGVGSYIEVTAPPNKEMGGIEFEGDKHITFITGTLDYGQGHASPFAQVLSSRLGVPFESIR